MSYKEMLEALNASTDKIKARRAVGNDIQSSYLMAPPQELLESAGVQPSALGGTSGGNPGKGGRGGRLNAFLEAISTQESGGDYGAVGVQTKYGRAYGKYQILDSNFVKPGGWDMETLGRDITLDEYLKNPKLQEKMARGKLTQYFKDYGARGAAKAWYAGPGNANTNSNSPQYGGPSINDYAKSVLKHMRGFL